jgi:hypothetical protein
MSNKNYDDAVFLLEASEAQASIEPGKISSLSELLKFLETYLHLSTYVSRLVWSFLKTIYVSVRRSNTSEYDPVLSQKLSDIMERDISASIFHSEKIEIYFSGKTLKISDWTVKFFSIREVAAQMIVQHSFSRQMKKIQFILEPLNYIIITLLYGLIERIKIKYGYREAITNKYLRATFDILIFNFTQLILFLPYGILRRQILVVRAAKDLKNSGFVDDFISAYKRWKKLSIDVKTTELGKVLLKIESWYKQNPSEKELIKRVIDDPEKLDIILGVSQRMF